MTEQEWLECTDPQKMLEFLREKVSARKLRLFGCACCRRIWHLLTDKRSQQAVAVAEDFAEGGASAEELLTAYYQANVACSLTDPSDLAALRASHLASTIAYTAVLYGVGCTPAAAEAVADSVADVRVNVRAYRMAFDAELAAQCKLLVDIFGNLLFHPMIFDLARLPQPTKHLAATIYEDRAFDRLALFADALEKAGCTDADILNHCRSEGPHVRGCWVVDLIVGKQ